MKNIDVTIAGTKYHAINVLRKPDNRLIIRTNAVSGQVFQADFHKLHHIRFQDGEETVNVRAVLKSAGNNTRTNEIEFSVVSD